MPFHCEVAVAGPCQQGDWAIGPPERLAVGPWRACSAAWEQAADAGAIHRQTGGKQWAGAAKERLATGVSRPSSTDIHNAPSASATTPPVKVLVRYPGLARCGPHYSTACQRVWQRARRRNTGPPPLP